MNHIFNEMKLGNKGYDIFDTYCICCLEKLPLTQNDIQIKTEQSNNSGMDLITEKILQLMILKVIMLLILKQNRLI